MVSNTVLKRIEKYARSLGYPKPPRRLSKNFREIDESSCNRIKQSLAANYLGKRRPISGKAYLSTDIGRNQLLDLLYRRLVRDRVRVIPWLDNVRAIGGGKFLEIGCGTGCSTVALAEQGASVTAVDIDADALTVAQERCETYGLDVSFVRASATDVLHLFRDEHFDFIIFYASLEHLTIEERITAMRDTWNMLKAGDFWAVIETPNRLWYHDDHTSRLPFFMWLPDDLAFQYSRFSPHIGFSEHFRDMTDASMLDFLRQGRGVSFHEFELAMAPMKELNIVSDISSFQRRRNMLNWLWQTKHYSHYRSFLSKVSPAASHGFNEITLDIIIRKDN